MRRKLSDRRQLQQQFEQAERRVAIRRQAQDRRLVNTELDKSQERRAEELEKLQSSVAEEINLPIEP
jgi:hypothetical protein